jgi:DNA polymerase-3 subunit gamma/tau
VLAEAGDGSMRDALSIMDQAIAGSGSTNISAEQVRGLVGSVSSEVLERLMDSVGNGSSQEVLQLIDKLVTEGQSPTHFVRQLVRFLRNAVVAKVAGPDSPLLQISQDERARVGRVASQFAEEDLTRFLNIALRTHDELGYKQEQRFHLELGVLKMVHAQRLLPMEELLSQQPISGNSRPAAPAALKAASAPPIQRTSEATSRSDRASAPASPSPFESDRARKGRPEMSSGAGLPAVSSTPETATKSATIVAAAAVATAMAIAEALPEKQQTTTPSPEQSVGLDDLRAAIIGSLEEAGQGMLANLLDTGEWSLEGIELTIKVAASAVMIDMSFGAEPKKLVNAAAANAAGKAIKVKVLSGGTANPNPPQSAHRGTARASGSARSRAADDPLVQYMKEKFGAEIRTVIDHQNKE